MLHPPLSFCIFFGFIPLLEKARIKFGQTILMQVIGLIYMNPSEAEVREVEERKGLLQKMVSIM